jgi:AmmeMemoRadiSam system protein B/AmmeMemoRadiSam system protein A
MKKYLVTLVGLLTLTSCTQAVSKNSPGIRKPAVSGKFYPADPTKLEIMVKGFINSAKAKVASTEIRGIIVPHAGYIYSGKTAGYGFKILKGREFSTVVLLGPSHHKFLKRLTGCEHKSWTTPLGEVEVDFELLKKLKREIKLDIDNQVFLPEHSLEVEIPFLQQVLKGKFKILPLLINDYRIETLRPIAAKLSKILKNRPGVLLVMSTDMSHYVSSSRAREMDSLVSQTLANNDLKKLQQILTSGQGQLCGAGGVMLGLMTLNELGRLDIERIHYSHSGMSTGDNSRVVGYGAFSIYHKDKERKMELTREQKIRLLKIARETIETYVKEGLKPDLDISDEMLKEERGVFVTLHKDGRLRGCIGNILPMNKLYLAVRDMAVESSTRDPRFPPVREEELKDIDIEVSVLTVPEQVKNADEVVLGRDGVIVKNGFRQGVYLPQVAEETGWTKEKFLSSLCYSKAGLSPDAWKKEGTQLLTFQAEVFGEKELGLR